MVMITKSLRPEPEQIDPVVARSHLEEQQAAIAEQIKADDARKLLARRRELAAKLPELQLIEDGESKRLLADVRRLESELEQARLARTIHDAKQRARVTVIEAEKKPIIAELFATAPAEIDTRIDDLQRQIVGAQQSRKTIHGGNPGKDPQRRSNTDAIDKFITAAGEAQNRLAALRLQALDDGELAKAIAKILKALPKQDFQLKEVNR